MKVSGRGIWIIVFFLVVMPLVVEVVLLFILPKNGPEGFSLLRSQFSGYLKFFPLYLLYLLVAFGIMFLIRNRGKMRDQK